MNTSKIIKYFLVILFATSLVVYFFHYQNYSNNQNSYILESIPQSKVVNISEIKNKTVSFAKPLIKKSLPKLDNSYITNTGVFVWTNNERLNNKKNLLSRSAWLDKVAEYRLDDMFKKQYFEHTAPDGVTLSDVADKIGYRYIKVGENLAMGNFKNDRDLIQAWMDSPGHRKNILRPEFTELGVASRKGMFKGNETWLAVQIFGRPLSLCTEPNEALKAGIDARINNVSLLESTLKNIKNDMEYLKNNNNFDLYNQKVEEYNNLVYKLNSLSDGIKVDVENYNIQVRQFNECANTE